jgi:3-hydroxyisobutyrate dehydrogenase-like beta-hydroxyacid dehydrogenase
VPRPIPLSQRLLAVFDDRERADRAALAARKAGAQVIERHEGAAAADAIDATGARRGLIARVGRAVQFSFEDQMPALAWYEAALRDGRVVLAIPTRSREQTRAVAAALEGAGGHFINRFGRLETEEISRWRGVEPDISSLLK